MERLNDTFSGPVDPLLEQGLLGGVGGELEGPFVSDTGLIWVAKPAEEFGAGGGVEVVVIELVGEGLEFVEGGLWPGGVAQDDGPVQPRDRRRGQVQEHVVEQPDL